MLLEPLSAWSYSWSHLSLSISPWTCLQKKPVTDRWWEWCESYSNCFFGHSKLCRYRHSSFYLYGCGDHFIHFHAKRCRQLFFQQWGRDLMQSIIHARSVFVFLFFSLQQRVALCGFSVCFLFRDKSSRIRIAFHQSVASLMSWWRQWRQRAWVRFTPVVKFNGSNERVDKGGLVSEWCCSRYWVNEFQPSVVVDGIQLVVRIRPFQVKVLLMGI